ncbi:unnamed protein product [Prorocentrum cordatum]|uniref:C2H2-type domain-containing protein n=1 Tax=Prorocentrum cordatum TaxID=2364126 RepID=A0ABN9XC80_9DINO|nr:unnamed protein product [Polarella glacialis]
MLPVLLITILIILPFAVLGSRGVKAEVLRVQLGIRAAAAMPETLEISKEAKSGNGTLENVGIKLDGQFKCPHCRQAFSDDKARQLHLKFQCPTAIAKQINPIGD